MKRVIPYLAFVFLTGSTTIIEIPLLAASCNHQTKNNINVTCPSNDNDCKTKKAEIITSKNNIESQK